MDSASIQFIAFGLAAALLSNLSNSRTWRSSVLMLMSIIFLALVAHSATVLLPILGFLVLSYVGLLLLERGVSRTAVWVLLMLLAYIWLKKYTFLPEKTFLRAPYITVGLSYILFRV
jgi:hypothetical protein